MRIPSFTTIYLAFKTTGSSLVLACGHGWACFLSFAITILLSFYIYWLYEVPLYSTELSVNKIYEQAGDEHFTNLYFRYDYGMGLTEKYRLDSANYASTIRITTLRDTCENGLCSYNVANIEFADPFYWDSIKSKWKQQGNPESYMSPRVLSPMFFIHKKANIPPRMYLRRTIPPDVYIIPTEKYEINSAPSVVTWEYSHANIKDTAWSIFYFTPCNVQNSFNGGEIDVFLYIGINRMGNSVEYELSSLSNTVKPAIYTPYDISQGYFHYKLDFPTTKRHASTVEINFGGASEILGISPQPDSITFNSIIFNSPQKIDEIRKNGLSFHAQFRQLENLQVLRMFVITTIWGFFVALTFSSGWKALRVRSRRFQLNQKKERKKEELLTYERSSDTIQ